MYRLKPESYRLIRRLFIAGCRPFGCLRTVLKFDRSIVRLFCFRLFYRLPFCVDTVAPSTPPPPITRSGAGFGEVRTVHFLSWEFLGCNGVSDSWRGKEGVGVGGGESGELYTQDGICHHFFQASLSRKISAARRFMNRKEI